MSTKDEGLTVSPNGHQTDVMRSLPISKVVFFELKNGKYLASNGVEVTTEFILKHEHAIFHDNGYVIVERQRCITLSFVNPTKLYAEAYNE